MDEKKLIIKKSEKLSGNVKISGSKNSVLPIICACILSKETVTINNAPPLSDVICILEILKELGARTNFDTEEEKITINCENINPDNCHEELFNKIRASILIAGPLLARFNEFKVPMPGGCNIGSRPIDLHLKGFKALGTKIKEEHGFVNGTCRNLIGTKIYLDFPSVGATENIILASIFCEGETIIENCANEPEIVDLSIFLNKLGANIKHAGTDTIKITGVKKLKGGEHTIIPDRIEAGTFMIASAITKGDIILENIIVDHLKPLIAKLKEMNLEIEENDDTLRIYLPKGKTLRPVDIKTMPYPGFPTDLQSQFLALLSTVKGNSVVTETVFENRFNSVPEISKMGGNIKIDSRTAIIEGTELSGANVKATDLRGGAALILAGLTAKNETEIRDIHHIERGYYRIEEKFKNLGANIELI